MDGSQLYETTHAHAETLPGAELLTESYLLVVAKLPRARRPVDPARYRHPSTD